jgi:TIR domain
MSQRKIDFFISYASADAEWAEWIGWVLEEQKLSIRLQAWDFVAGSNFVLEMQRAAAEAARTVAVLSPAYLKSTFAAPEWAAAFANDPQGINRLLLPVRVRECEPAGLLKAIVYIDLVGLNENGARQRLLDALRGRRAKPSTRPRFPAASGTPQSHPPPFPGAGVSKVGRGSRDRYMPNLRRSPSDLDKRRFLQTTFDSLVQHFEGALHELAVRHDGIDYELKQITSAKYVAEVFVDGKSRARCKFWIAGQLGGAGIAYSEVDFGSDTDNSYNEFLSLNREELALNPLMGAMVADQANGLNLERLTAEDAAEFLWRRFASQLDRGNR